MDIFSNSQEYLLHEDVASADSFAVTLEDFGKANQSTNDDYFLQATINKNSVKKKVSNWLISRNIWINLSISKSTYLPLQSILEK